jgi:hypothetical protein
MGRLARFIWIGVLLASTCAACASPRLTPAPTPTASIRGTVLPPLPVLRAAFERLGVRFAQDAVNWPDPVLDATNQYLGSSGNVFFMLQIVGVPPKQVLVTLPPFHVDANGRFPGSALIDILDSIDPGLKPWYIAQATDPTLGDTPRTLHLNGLIAKVESPFHLTIVVEVDNGVPS